jgi:hypothetical protein
METKTEQSRKILGWFSPPTVVLFLMILPETSLMVAGVASNSHETLTSILSDTIVFALGAAVGVLGASSRIVGTVDGIQIVNFFFRVELPAKNIGEIRSSKGLVFLTTDGKQVGCFAYGSSLIGDLLGYRRARLAQQRCEAWVQARRFDNVSISRPHAKRFRQALIWTPLVLVTAYFVEALVIHKLTS